MFKELTDKVHYSDVEKVILAFWETNKIFEKSISSREGKPQYTFYEGPPTANGRPGIHHVMARALKDIVCRYKTMSGCQVHRKAGWDTHGLPVEIEVEKMLGIKHKDDILAYGVEKFNEECKKSVWKYKTEWETMTREMGYWVDLSNPYITFTNEYMESVWWALKRYFDAGMIYKGYKIQPYCPRCETPLSSHEVALGYKDVKDPSVYVKMKVKGETNTHFLVWTTTPWTLISNVAIAVHPKIEYVKAELMSGEDDALVGTGEFLILAKARLGVLKDKYKIISEFPGKELAGKEYERLFNYHQTKEKGWYVVEADFVTTEDGSGIVHMAPAYGEDDYQTGRKYGLPTIHPVNKSGEFDETVTDFKGKFVKDADAEIIQDLKSRNILYKKEAYLHSYPHCWRCASPLLYYARESWYISTTKYAHRMTELNKQINWIPAETGSGRFGNWLEENKDWALSRDRYWGTPLPIWVCEKCGHLKCIGSIEELKQGKNFPKLLDLHKPSVDPVTFSCEKCNGTMRRTPELIDVWFDSGAMPFAQWHYPFENNKIFDKAYPADFISEGIDQTRGWFYTLHSIGTFLFDKPAFKNCLVNDLILDKQGQKMSKSKGNTVNPFELIERYGADATRWYLVANSPVWRPTLFDEEGIAEVQRKFFSTLVNTYSFFALYANIDQFVYSESRIPVAERAEIDQWILSSLNTLVRSYTQFMEEYDLTKAARAVSDFTIDHLSNWYVRRNRRRFWKSEKGKDKTAAYQTLYECLITVIKMMAPFAPFLADELYRGLNSVTKREQFASVHLSSFQAAEVDVIDKELEDRMERAVKIVGIVRAMRMKSNLKVRQPLKKIIVPISNEEQKQSIVKMEDVILDEINVKAIEFVHDESDIVIKKAKPNFRSLGQKYGKQVQAVAAKVREMTSQEITSLQKTGAFIIPVNGSTYSITSEDVEVLHEDLHGWLVETDGGMTVALDTEITPELRNEGFAREFVNRVQNMRKEAGFDVTDRISIYYAGTDVLMGALESMKEYIAHETLAVDVYPTLHAGEISSKESINGEVCDISVERAR
ncbi:MAG: isoleucine--tRNA ligase [Bacteroidota bacterium]